MARRRRVSPYCGAHFARHVAPSFAPRSEPPDGGRKGTAVHFVRPVLQLGLRKVVGRTQLNVLRAAMPSLAACGPWGPCNRYRRGSNFVRAHYTQKDSKLTFY